MNSLVQPYGRYIWVEWIRYRLGSKGSQATVRCVRRCPWSVGSGPCHSGGTEGSLSVADSAEPPPRRLFKKCRERGGGRVMPKRRRRWRNGIAIWLLFAR
jgi:hypothetical protein|eukprot:COSAG01_NODE_197_length_22333_cov_45.774759_16_plen_100_part_00